MSDDETDASRFYKRAEAFYLSLARKRNLGIALGRWEHPRFGPMRIIAVNGWIGRLYVTLVCAATDAALMHEQVRLWWYLSDQAEPFEFKHVAIRRPMAEWTTRGMLMMGKAALKELVWLERQTSLEATLAHLFERNISPIGKLGEALADPDNELPSEGLPEEKPS
jgi:hypothetical protein